MRIAQVAPLFESVPPALYGGSERVVSWLTEELVSLGHEVTLFASGDSVTSARLIPACDRALWQDGECRETLPHVVRMLELVLREQSNFDIIHFHCDYVHFPLVGRAFCPNVTTLHGYLNPHDVGVLLEEYREVPLVSISNNQRLTVPRANWRGTVYHGLPEGVHTYTPNPGSYFAFLGRISPEKGVERAIEISRRTGTKLKIAAKIYEEDRHYWEHVIEPLIATNSSTVEFVREVGGITKDSFLGNAKALLFPIHWAEPFGLVMIEAMACGTPILAWRNGSVPEIIEDGVNGFIVDDLEEAVDRIRDLSSIKRANCRKIFETRFGARRMAQDYLNIYARLIHDPVHKAFVPHARVAMV